MKAARLDPAGLLARTLAAHARSLTMTMDIRAISARGWASATFEGERVALELSGLDAEASWLLDLREAELPIRGHIVADLMISPLANGTLRLEALLIRVV